MTDQRQGGRGRQQQRSAATAVVAAQSGQQQAPADGAQRALVAVTREIDNRLAIVGASAAAGIKPDRLKLVALGAFTRTPALWTCDPVSVARSIVEAGQLGLEPTGLLGGAYLVPRGNQCTLLVGYRGLVMLAKRSGEVARVEARVVRQKDLFEYAYGDEPYLRHTPSREADPGPYTDAYAIIFYRDGSKQFDVMSLAEIEAIRSRSSAARSGPWVTDWAEMAKKTPLRRLMKLAPLTVEVRQFLEEFDPEVDEAAPARADTREAELRQQLQAALEREYGGGGEEPPAQAPAPQPAQAPAAEEGTFREVGNDEAAGDGGKGAAAAKPAQPAAAAPAQASALCGASSEKLGAGPCVLPAHHQREQYTVGAITYPPQAEHEEAGGTRWSQPR